MSIFLNVDFLSHTCDKPIPGVVDIFLEKHRMLPQVVEYSSKFIRLQTLLSTSRNAFFLHTWQFQSNDS